MLVCATPARVTSSSGTETMEQRLGRSLPARAVRRLLDTFPVRVLKRYGAASGGTWATAIRWNILFAFFPIIVAVTTILGVVTGGSQLGPQIDRDIAAVLRARRVCWSCRRCRVFTRPQACWR